MHFASQFRLDWLDPCSVMEYIGGSWLASVATRNASISIYFQWTDKFGGTMSWTLQSGWFQMSFELNWCVWVRVRCATGEISRKIQMAHALMWSQNYARVCSILTGNSKCYPRMPTDDGFWIFFEQIGEWMCSGRAKTKSSFNFTDFFRVLIFTEWFGIDVLRD